MDKRNELIVQTTDRLKRVQNMDDLKASEVEIAALTEKLFQSSIDEFRSFTEKMEDMPEEDLHAKAAVFQEESFLLPPAVMNEFERIDGLPGDQEFLDGFNNDLEKRIEPFFDQYGRLAEKLMEKLMSGSLGRMMQGMAVDMENAVEGMTDTIGSTIGGMMQDLGDEEVADEFVFDYNNPATPRMMYELYAAPSWEEMDKDVLIEDMEEQLQNDIWELEALTDEGFSGPTEEDLERIEEMRTRMDVFESELDKELDRLGSKSGHPELAAALKVEIMKKISSKVIEIRHYLAKL